MSVKCAKFKTKVKKRKSYFEITAVRVNDCLHANGVSEVFVFVNHT